MIPRNAVEKYLRLYSEPFAQSIRLWLIETCKTLQWQHCIIVPAYGESQLGRRCLESLTQAAEQAKQSLLIILMINAHPESDASILEDNEAFFRNLQSMGLSQARHERLPAQILEMSHQVHCLLLHCGSAPYLLSRKQAVGQARKTMADIAADLYHQNKLQSPLCFSTDADTLWPSDFFQSIEQEDLSSQPGFVQLSFRHDLDPLAPEELRHLGHLYDLHMQGYCRELEAIIPAYAYIPIGGAMAFDLSAYAMVRGFPKKDAAEDFYLANKLVKIASFKKLNNATLSLSPRFSQRVPFGTGMSLQKISDEIHTRGHARTYNPACFRLLAQFLVRFEEQVNESGPIHLEASSFNLSSDKVAMFQDHLNAMQAEACIHRLRKVPQAQREQRFLEWFDALKILRFVNLCHRHFFEPVRIINTP